MNERTKIILFAVGCLLCAGLAWYLFSVPGTGPTDSYHVEDGFDRTAREQQKATDSIDAVSRGLEESTGCATDIGTSIEADQRRADSIQSRNAELETGIDSITERNRAALERLGEAEARNADAAAAAADAAAAVESGRELTRRSAEILGRYASGVAEERESARTDGNPSKK